MNIKFMDEWLILKSIQKAKQNFDKFNLSRFENYKNQKLHNAQRSELNFYLFNSDKGIFLDIQTVKRELKILKRL